MRHKITLAAVILAFVANSGAAQSETLEQCSQIGKDAERVACYDAIANSGTAPVTTSAELVACESSLISKIVSPTGYKRVSVSENTGAIPLEEWIDSELVVIRDRNLNDPERAVQERAEMRRQESRMIAQGELPVKTTITIIYDAPNRMNAMIRGEEACITTRLP